MARGPADGDPAADADLVDVGMTQPTASMLVATPAPPEPELPRGSTLGRYLVLDRIGAGGMGVVFCAYDPELDRRVALKVLRRLGEPGSEGAARLLAEAKALAQLAHPNVVSIFDVGRHGDSVFIAMELVEGVTLRAWLAQSPRTPAAILAIFAAAGRGLVAAHRAGLVHRDFKPSNVIVGADGRARVLDFGLARSAFAQPRRADQISTEEEGAPAPREGAPAPRPGVSPAPRPPAPRPGVSPAPHPEVAPEALTHAGRVVGTPRYMAPEQQLGQPVGPACDQYSFCVALFEALTGETPFAGASSDEVLASALGGRVRDTKATRALAPRVRRALVRGLAGRPEARFADMEALLAVLERRPRRRLAAAALVVTAVGAGIAFVAAGAGRPPAPCQQLGRQLDGVWDADARARLDGPSVRLVERWASTWVREREAACRETRVAGTQSEEMLDRRVACLDRRRQQLGALLAALADPAAGSAPSAAGAAGAATGAARAAEALAALPLPTDCADKTALAAAYPPPASAQARAAVATAERELDTADAAWRAGAFARSAELAAAPLARAQALAHPPLVAEAWLVEARARRGLSEWPATQAALRAAVLAAARARDDARVAQAWLLLADVIGRDLRRHDEGLALLEVAAAAIARAGDPPLLVAALAHGRGLLHLARGDHAEARAAFERAVDGRRQHLPADHPDLAESWNAIGMLATDEGRYPEALAAHERALETRRAALGDGHPLVASSLDNLGVVYYRLGDLPGAITRYDEALARRVAVLGAEHRDVGTSHNNLAGALLDSGRLADARQHFEAARAIYVRVGGEEHPDVAMVDSNLGELALREGDPARAAAVCARALAVEERRLGAAHPELAWNLTCLGEALVELGRAREAAVPLERALVLRETQEGIVAERGRTRAALARALWLVGADRPRARRLAQSARSDWATAGEHTRAQADAFAAWGQRRGAW